MQIMFALCFLFLWRAGGCYFFLPRVKAIRVESRYDPSQRDQLIQERFCHFLPQFPAVADKVQKRLIELGLGHRPALVLGAPFVDPSHGVVPQTAAQPNSHIEAGG